MANTARTNTKTTSKFYDNMSVNDWNLNFEYETENGVLGSKLTVNGAKGNSSVFISKQNNQFQTVFGGGGYDADVVAAVVAEFEAIKIAYAPVPPAPTEGE